MAPIIADCVRISVKGTQPAGTWANVFHVQDLGTGTAADDMTNDFGIAFQANILDFMTAQWVITGYDYVDLSSTTGDSGSMGPRGTNFTGRLGGFGAPPNVATLVRWSATGGRSQRSGRSYFGGVDEDAVDTAGNYTSGAEAAAQAKVTTFLSALQSADLGIAVLSHSGEGPYVVRAISGGDVQTKVATQRRRLRA